MLKTIRTAPPSSLDERGTLRSAVRRVRPSRLLAPLSSSLCPANPLRSALTVAGHPSSSSTLSSPVHATKESTLFPSLPLSSVLPLLSPRVEALLSASLLNLPSPLPHEDPFLRRLSLRFSRRARDIALVMALRTSVSGLARSRRRCGQTDWDDFQLLQQVPAAPLIPSVLLVPAATPRRSSPIPRSGMSSPRSFSLLRLSAGDDGRGRGFLAERRSTAGLSWLWPSGRPSCG